MKQVTRFVSIDGKDYLFPDSQGRYSDNFTESQERMQPLPSSGGGFDNDGNAPSRPPPGKLQFTLFLYSSTRDEMTAKLDSIKSIRGWGYGKLYLQPSNSQLLTRYVVAKCVRVDAPEDFGGHTDLILPVTMHFSIPNPYWFGQGVGTDPLFGEMVIGDFTIGGNPLEFAIAGGTPQTVTVAVAGTLEVYPQITIRATTGKNVIRPRISRVVNGQTRDEIYYPFGLLNGSQLFIDCKTKTVTRNGGDVYDDMQFLRGEWMVLPAGDNTIVIDFFGNSDDGVVSWKFPEKYY